jgi:ABC-type lipoprotein release transport system permease subunit
VVIAIILTLVFTSSFPQYKRLLASSLTLKLALISIPGAALLTVAAGWIPSMIASGHDPAEVHKEE